MSQNMKLLISENVIRRCGFSVLGVGIIMVSLSAEPFIAIKAGGIAALIVTFALLQMSLHIPAPVKAANTTTERTNTKMVDLLFQHRAQCYFYAFLFAVLAFALFSVHIAGQMNMSIYG